MNRKIFYFAAVFVLFAVLQTCSFAAINGNIEKNGIGDYNQVTVAEVENLMKGDGSGRVSR